MLQISEMPEGIEIAPVAIIPPMKLQEVERRHAHSRERDADRVRDDTRGHRPGMGNPFCERLDLGQPLGAVQGGEPAAEFADQILGRAVMVGQVPGGEPGIVVGEHRLDGAGGVDPAMGAGDLPHPIEDAADRKIGSEPQAARFGERHRLLLRVAPDQINSARPTQERAAPQPPSYPP